MDFKKEKTQGSFFVKGAESVFVLLKSVIADLGLFANKVFVSEQTRSRLHWCCMQAFGFDVTVSPNCHAQFEYFAALKSHQDLQTSVSWDKCRSSHHWRMPQSMVLTQLLKELWNETFLYKKKTCIKYHPPFSFSLPCMLHCYCIKLVF